MKFSDWNSAPGLGSLVAAVEEALVVLGPGGVGELGPFQLVGQLPAGGDFHDVPDRPVAAGLGAAVGQVLAVVAEAHLAQGDRAVFRPRVGVDQDPRLGLERIGHVEHGLVLQAVVLEEEVAAAFLHVGRVLGEVPELGQAAADRLALGDGGQVGLGELVLGLDPLGHLGRVADVVLQPAVGIGHLGAEVGVDVIDAAGFGVVETTGVRVVGTDGRNETWDSEKKKEMVAMERRHTVGPEMVEVVECDYGK